GFVRAEYPRRVALARRDRSGMVEQRSDLSDRHRDIGPQRVFAEELIEELTDRALPERNPAAVPGRMPGVARMQRVVHERLEHRRGQALDVQFRRAGDGAGQELRRILE